MLDLHEGILTLFAEAHGRARRVHAYDYFGGRSAMVQPERSPRSPVMRCASCGRRGHYTTTCVNFDDWNEPPAWLRAS